LEKNMAKASKNQKKKSNKSKVDPHSPWIKMRTGLIVISIVSIGMAIFMGWPAYQAMGIEGILWGLGFGAAIWVIFFGAMYLNRLFRGNR
jgi:hypothetical protein